MIPLPRHRKELERLGLDLSLPPWPEYLQAYATKNRELRKAAKDCPDCYIDVEEEAKKCNCKKG